MQAIRHAAGAIIYQEQEYLLVHKVKGMDTLGGPTTIPGVWDFPKGGIKAGKPLVKLFCVRSEKKLEENTTGWSSSSRRPLILRLMNRLAAVSAMIGKSQRCFFLSTSEIVQNSVLSMKKSIRSASVQLWRCVSLSPIKKRKRISFEWSYRKSKKPMKINSSLT